jgi:hypothetical protein
MAHSGTTLCNSKEFLHGLEVQCFHTTHPQGPFHAPWLSSLHVVYAIDFFTDLEDANVAPSPRQCMNFALLNDFLKIKVIYRLLVVALL